MFEFLLFFSYRASLIQETAESAFHNIDDFKSCRIPDSQVCFVGGDAVELFWKNSISQLYVLLRPHISLRIGVCCDIILLEPRSLTLTISPSSFSPHIYVHI